MTAQERFTTPANHPPEKLKSVAVFPVVAPALIAIAPALSVKLACVTLIVPVPVDPE